MKFTLTVTRTTVDKAIITVDAGTYPEACSKLLDELLHDQHRYQFGFVSEDYSFKGGAAK